jgi:membrane-associated phospholipid phosphatase
VSESTIALPEVAPSAPPREPARPPQWKLNDAVPVDPWLYVRIAGFAIFVVLYIWWFLARGLIIDRISVAISVGIFIAIGHLGRPLRRWGLLVFDCLLYCVMWFCYEESRGWADHAGLPLQVEMPRNIDRFLFFGTDPSVWMQRHFYDPGVVHWYDKVASATYYTHFIFPVIAIAVVWVTSRREWARFMKRFASVLVVACAMFVLMPTVPPWMAGDRKYPYHVLPPLARHTGSGFSAMGLKGFVKVWQTALEWGNAVAAMPSLHAAFALFVPAFFLPLIKPVWLKALALTFPLLMLTSLVYFGEHYVIDGLVGWALVGLSFLFWGWFEKRQRRLRAERSRIALGLQVAA